MNGPLERDGQGFSDDLEGMFFHTILEADLFFWAVCMQNVDGICMK